MDFIAIVSIADIAVEAPDIRGAEIAVAVVVHAFQGAVDRPIADLIAPLQRTLETAERAPHHVNLRAVIVEAIFHLNRDGAAKRIETLGRIFRHHGDRLYRPSRYQVPIDGIAERLVDTDTVLIDRQSLRRTRNRRRNKTTELDIRLKLISGDVADVDPCHVLPESIHDVEGIGTLDFRRIYKVDAGGNFVNGQRRARGGSGRWGRN